MNETRRQRLLSLPAFYGPVLQVCIDQCTPMMLSNLYTMGHASKHDPRQQVPEKPEVPSAEVRLVRARLLLEETFETLNAMGITVHPRDPGSIRGVTDLELDVDHSHAVVMDDVVDGCLDVQYVTTGTLAAFGVPDARATDRVLQANGMKFINGGNVNADGKFTKPEGWLPPECRDIIEESGNCLQLVQAAVMDGYAEQLQAAHDEPDDEVSIREAVGTLKHALDCTEEAPAK